MRHDIKYVILDRYGRTKHEQKFNRRPNRLTNITSVWNEDTDEKFVNTQTMSRFKKFSNAPRQADDFLSPIRRFLEKNIGRKWDDIYSEVCRVADSKSLRGFHVRQHLSMLHDSDCVNYLTDSVWRKYVLYVDNDGILRQKENKWI